MSAVFGAPQSVPAAGAQFNRSNQPPRRFGDLSRCLDRNLLPFHRVGWTANVDAVRPVPGRARNGTVGYENETPKRQPGSGQRSRARDTARNVARSVYTAASCALYAAEPDRSARNSSPSAARAAADLIVAGSAPLP
jgi:hypothetical protein